MFNVGDRVLAMWPVEMEWWYPGTVVAIDGDFFDICYDDGQRARLAEVQLRQLSIGVGNKVYCQWKGGDQYYPGKVTRATKEAVHVQYDDGDAEDSIVGMIRVHQDDL
ncbi:MAG: hypothetical protein ABIV13_05240 [Fimbriimonadales bacterium]